MNDSPSMMHTRSIEDLLAADKYLTSETDGYPPQNDGFNDFLSSDEFLKAVDRAIIEEEQSAHPSNEQHDDKNPPVVNDDLFSKRLPYQQRRSRKLPKRPISSYNYFFRRERPKVMKEFPNATFGMVARIIGQRWGSLDADTKAELDKLHRKDAHRYHQEMKAVRRKQLEDIRSRNSQVKERTEPSLQLLHPIPPSPTTYRLPLSSETMVIHPDWAKNSAPVSPAFTPPEASMIPEKLCCRLQQDSIVHWNNQMFRVDYHAYRMKASDAKRFLNEYCNTNNEISMGQLLSIGIPPGQPLHI